MEGRRLSYIFITAEFVLSHAGIVLRTNLWPWWTIGTLLFQSFGYGLSLKIGDLGLSIVGLCVEDQCDFSKCHILAYGFIEFG